MWIRISSLTSGRRNDLTRSYSRHDRGNSGETWVATTDADSYVPTKWLRQMFRFANLGFDARQARLCSLPTAI